MTRIDLMNARFYLRFVAWTLAFVAFAAEIALGVWFVVM